LVEPVLQKISDTRGVKNLEPQLMAVLQLLSANAGQVVTKDQLMEAVWPDVVVTENVLTRAISSLRKALGDNSANPKYIETISKTGYRLIAPVKTVRPETNKPDDGFFTIKLARRPTVWLVGLGLLVALGAFTTIRMFLSTPAQKSYQPVSLANFANAEYWPSISPDGKFVAYGWKGEADDNWDIYARLIGTEQLIRVTNNPATDLRARWSADGNYIYYLRYENGGSTIYKKSLLGNNEIRVLRSPQYATGDFDVSPDEKWISFNGKESRSEPARVKLLSLESGKEKYLTNPGASFKGDIHATFSPDGKKLAFIREKNPVSMQLWLYDLKSGESQQITTEHLSINGFDWSEDGESLVYGSDKSAANA